jgi:DNA polymerase (family 10)
VPGPPAPPGPPGLQYPADRVAAALLEAADLLEAFGENPHRVRAYRRGAEVLVRHADRFAGLLAAGRLTELPGIGRELAAVAALKARIPPAAAALGGVPGVDRKTAIYLASRLRVTTVADLAALAGTHLLRAVPWLGPEGGRRIEAGVRAVAGR